MIVKGQLVEIPANAPLYHRDFQPSAFSVDELTVAAQPYRYSLFDGFLVGEHPGCEHFKLGQRKGISVGGKKAPLYVIGIDRAENRVFVGEGQNHPGLWRKVLALPLNISDWPEEFHLESDKAQEGFAVNVSATNFSAPLEATLYVFGDKVFLKAAKLFPVSLLNENLTVHMNSNLIINNIKPL